MKLKIEQWIDTNEIFNGTQRELFNESVICYKVGAYHSAFIMSYLAFKVTVRDRILKTNYLADNYTDIQWKKQIIEPLKDEDNWEDNLNKIITINPTKNNQVIKFSNHEEAMQEYNYWRAYRNSVAHAKSKKIDSSTVEHFWNYLMDSLSKFYVRGGQEYLLNRFLEIYQYSQTIPIVELDKVLDDVGHLYKANVDSFFKEILVRLSAINRSNIVQNNNTHFWDKIINNINPNIRDGFYKAIVEHKKYFFNVYTYYETIFAWIVENNKCFIIDTIFPKIISGHSLPGLIDWKLFYQSMVEYNTDMDDAILKIVQNNYWLRSLQNIDVESYWIPVFNSKEIFKKMILNAGDFYFRNNSDSHNEQFCNGQNEDIVEIWFKYVNWDEELLKRFKNSVDTLQASMSYRPSGTYSETNGYRRKNSYLRVINHAKSIYQQQSTKDTLLEIENILNLIK